MDSFYESVVNSSPITYAHHKIILSKDGTPCDFELLDVNAAYEKLIGFARKDLIGKWVYQLIPALKNDSIDWVGLYGEVALKQKTVEIKEYSSVFKKWFCIKAVSPKKFYFITYISDITKEVNQFSPADVFFNTSPDMLSISDLNGRLLQVNQGWEALLGYSQGELTGKDFTFFMHPDDTAQTVEKLSGLKQDIPTLNLKNRCRHKNGSYRYIEWHCITRGEYLYSTARDITEVVLLKEQYEQSVKKTNELLVKETESLNLHKNVINVLQYSAENEQDYLNNANEQALQMTKSQYGYIFLYNQEKQVFTINSWSAAVNSDCSIKNAPSHYHLSETGLWGEVVRQRKPILINDFQAPNPLKKGHPKGHVPIKNYLSVPVYDQNKIVAVVGVANKASDYTQDDQVQLSLLMNNVWAVLQRKRSEESYRHENELFKAALLSIGDGILAVNTAGSIYTMNEIAEKLTGWLGSEAIGKNLNDVFQIINEKTGKPCECSMCEVLGSGEIIKRDYRILLQSKDGTRRPVSYSAAPILNEGGSIKGAVLAFRDITLEKEKIAAIEHMSYHDLLTGLYNRAYFERAIRRCDTPENLPLTIVMGDANGLKVTNDSFGHDVGDILLQRAAAVLSKNCRQGDIIARTGGDEFMILMPKTDKEQALAIMEKIKKECSCVAVGSIMLSISFGWETKTDMNVNIREIRKASENMMYRTKLFERPDFKNSVLSNIIKTLYDLHGTEQEHSVHVRKLCELMSKELGFSENEQKELIDAALLHDIGKIAIDEKTLNKTDSLSVAEWAEIKRHPETGYRVLCTVSEFSNAARFVLAHHERWDGKGYPKGLKGEEIPLQARMIAIVEAYDSMVTGKPYKNALNKQEAVEELKKNSGTQFDPSLVELFVSVIDKVSI